MEARHAVDMCEGYLQAMIEEGARPEIIECFQNALAYLAAVKSKVMHDPELVSRMLKLEAAARKVSWSVCKMTQEVVLSVLKGDKLSGSMFHSAGRLKQSDLVTWLHPSFKHEVIRKDAWLEKVDRVVVSIRWLSFRSAIRHDPSPLTKLTAAIAEKSSEEKDERTREAEKFHYDLVELLCKHAASGQPGVDMTRFQRAESDGEDVSAVVNEKSSAIEVKRFLTRELAGAAFDKVLSLSEEVKQLLHYLRFSDGWTGTQVGGLVFAHLLFVMEADFEEGKVKRIQQAPVFPDFMGSKEPMLEMYDRQRLYQETADDPDVVFDAQPSEGFSGLVALVNRMCVVNGQALEGLRFVTDDGAALQVVVGGELLYSGMNSVVLSCRAHGEEACSSVLKVQPESESLREEDFHRVLDTRVRGVRSKLSSGCVVGAGIGLRFIQLAGFGSPLSFMDMAGDGARLMAQAACKTLEGVHRCGVYHRDIKPGNLIVVDGCLLLNDFDLSCSMDEWLQRYFSVGTSLFSSPRWASECNPLYEEVDDWLSLALTLAYLMGIHRDQSTKTAALNMVSSADWAPDVLRNRLAAWRLDKL